MSIIRDLTEKAKSYLATDEILLFIGARQVGKTTILQQLKEHIERTSHTPIHFLNLEDPDYRALLNDSPKQLFKIIPLNLSKNSVVFLDEIQYLRDPSSALKYWHDEYKERVKIIASGSSAFYLDQKFTDSLAGRKRILYVYTLSFPEFLRFKQETFFSNWRTGPVTLQERERLIRFMSEYLVYGGYPRVVLAPLEEKRELLKELAYSYVKKDVLEARVRQEEIFYRALKTLASQVGQLVNVAELSATLGVSKTALDHYLWVMQKSFHVALIAPFFKNMRKELTKMRKVFFYDVGLRNFFVDNFKPFVVREDRGAVLENAAFRQFLEHYDTEEIRFWRTTNGQEVDFVLREEKAVEVKLNPEHFTRRALKAFSAQYPHIPYSIVSFDTAQNVTEKDALPIQPIWEL